VFGVVPAPLAFLGMAVTCVGVALVAWKSPRVVAAAVD
jgi:hypothetical protein